MTATFYVGNAVTVMNTLPERSVDLILTSPPFLALRSYLPQDHSDKALEGGLQATPGAYIDWLLDVVEACARILAPHGSLCFELGDTYSGSAPMYDGRESAIGTAYAKRLGPGNAAGTGWPLAKSLSLIPETFRFAMVYGHNPHTGRQTEPWRLRNVIRWVRPNPPVGALGDKFRPATSELMVFCKAKDRFFDLDAVREAFSGVNAETQSDGWAVVDSKAKEPIGRAHTTKEHRPYGNPGGAPPLDWWNIPPGGYSGFTTWKTKLPVDPATYDGFSGDIQHTVSADCPEHGDQVDPLPTGSHDGRGAIEPNRSHSNGNRLAQEQLTDFAPTDLLPALNPGDGSSDSLAPKSISAATDRSKASSKTARVPATSPVDTPAAESSSRIAHRSTSPFGDVPNLDSPQNKTAEADPFLPSLETDADTDRIPGQPSACTCSYFVEKANTTSHYAVWPPELLVKPIKAMCPESVCRVCGEARSRIVGDPVYSGRSGVVTPPAKWESGSPERGRPQQAIGMDSGGYSVSRPTLGFSDCGHKCAPCEGTGVIGVYEHVDQSTGTHLGNQSIPCPTCGGRGDPYRPGLVLDPFAGSGTTLSVATGHGRDAIGIDLDERNYELALDRVGPLVLERGEVAA